MCNMVVNYLLFLKKTCLIGGITLLTAVINVILNYFLISTVGAIGAAYGTALALFIQFILTWIVSIKSYKMPWCNWLTNFRN